MSSPTEGQQVHSGEWQSGVTLVKDTVWERGSGSTSNPVQISVHLDNIKQRLKTQASRCQRCLHPCSRAEAERGRSCSFLSIRGAWPACLGLEKFKKKKKNSLATTDHSACLLNILRPVLNFRINPKMYRCQPGEGGVLSLKVSSREKQASLRGAWGAL